MDGTAMADGRRPLKMQIGKNHTSCRSCSGSSRMHCFRASPRSRAEMPITSLAPFRILTLLFRSAPSGSAPARPDAEPHARQGRRPSGRSAVDGSRRAPL